MRMERFQIEHIPAVLYGDPSEKLYLFFHGKTGVKEEGADFAETACPKGWQVLGIDLPEHGERQNGEGGFDPWHVVPEFRLMLAYARERWTRIAVRANSVGAWYAMLAFAEEPLEQALFVSPILSMEKLLLHVMNWMGVDEQRLENEVEIPTGLGETLSWPYYSYVKEHPITTWNTKTEILYPSGDTLTNRETVDEFVREFGCGLTVMEDGEHWFHTGEQVEFLHGWEREKV